MRERACVRQTEKAEYFNTEHREGERERPL